MFDSRAIGATPATADSTRINNTIHTSISVDGTQTTTSLLTPPQLETSTLLTLLESMVNKAFSHAIATGPQDLAPSSFRRLHSGTQMVNEIGPEAFTFVVHTPFDEKEDVRVFATATGKRSTSEIFDPKVELVSQFKMLQGADLDINVEQWELLFMVVDPTVQKQGLAGKVMGLAEEEIRRRTTGEGKEVQVILSTAKEHNEKFYTRRGYMVTGETKIEAGTHGSIKGFSIVKMMKRL